ncbi:hypothetical protein CDAR_207411 [Caerostris darwini]|uniref:Uncharacterized protein n=1 Tax=Caerostris darwini TaxID=1538125 RepID=A0AAV4VJ52_9ARAC|nr:hypothetical protein CDAR_207411 [Caerostris darwini]
MFHNDDAGINTPFKMDVCYTNTYRHFHYPDDEAYMQCYGCHHNKGHQRGKVVKSGWPLDCLFSAEPIEIATEMYGGPFMLKPSAST